MVLSDLVAQVLFHGTSDEQLAYFDECLLYLCLETTVEDGRLPYASNTFFLADIGLRFFMVEVRFLGFFTVDNMNDGFMSLTFEHEA